MTATAAAAERPRRRRRRRRVIGSDPRRYVSSEAPERTAERSTRISTVPPAFTSSRTRCSFASEEKIEGGGGGAGRGDGSVGTGGWDALVFDDDGDERGGRDEDVEGVLRDVYGDEAVDARFSAAAARRSGRSRPRRGSRPDDDDDEGGNGNANATGGGGGGDPASPFFPPSRALGSTPLIRPPPSSSSPKPPPPPKLAPLAPGTLSSLGPDVETSLHTWHVIRLTNPDPVRPLSYRTYVQRPECFAVYPSGGYLRPGGGTDYLTLCVRSLGSVAVEAFDEVDVWGEEWVSERSALALVPALAPPFLGGFFYVRVEKLVNIVVVSFVGGENSHPLCRGLSINFTPSGPGPPIRSHFISFISRN